MGNIHVNRYIFQILLSNINVKWKYLASNKLEFLYDNKHLPHFHNSCSQYLLSIFIRIDKLNFRYYFTWQNIHRLFNEMTMSLLISKLHWQQKFIQGMHPKHFSGFNITRNAKYQILESQRCIKPKTCPKHQNHSRMYMKAIIAVTSPFNLIFWLNFLFLWKIKVSTYLYKSNLKYFSPLQP